MHTLLFYYNVCSVPHAHCTMYTLYPVHCTTYTVRTTNVPHAHCTLYTVPRTLYDVKCMSYTVRCTLYDIHCTLYTVRCILYDMHYTTYTVIVRAYTSYSHRVDNQITSDIISKHRKQRSRHRIIVPCYVIIIKSIHLYYFLFEIRTNIVYITRRTIKSNVFLLWINLFSQSLLNVKIQNTMECVLNNPWNILRICFLGWQYF